MDNILKYNQQFVGNKQYKSYETNKYPDKNQQLLPETLGIKNAGGVISHPFGSAVRSLLIAIYELGVEEIFVVGHTDCGVQHIDSQDARKRCVYTLH